MPVPNYSVHIKLQREISRSCLAFLIDLCPISEHGSDSSPLGTATGAFVLLYMLRLCWSNFYTFSMEPSLADITANPEFIICIAIPTCSTGGTLLIIFPFIQPPPLSLSSFPHFLSLNPTRSTNSHHMPSLSSLIAATAIRRATLAPPPDPRSPPTPSPGDRT